MAKKKAAKQLASEPTADELESAASVAKSGKRLIESCTHEDKHRSNHPPVGIVTPVTDPPEPPRKRYAFDPHLDPALQFDSQGA